MSWQAPKFYPKHGYTLFGTVEDYPIKGEAQYSFQKDYLKQIKNRLVGIPQPVFCDSSIYLVILRLTLKTSPSAIDSIKILDPP